MKSTLTLLAFFLVAVPTLHADLKTDLANINSSIISLDSNVTDLNLTADRLCAPLIAVNRQAKALLDTIDAANGAIAAPVALDNDTLLLLENLYINVATLSNTTSLLATEITLLQPATDAIALKDGITAMLQLSSDIGEMADRIGEMADNILVMSDNIGLMADRILVTQTIQSENVALTQNSILQTQTNILTVVSVAESASYDLSLDSLVVDGNILLYQLSLVALNPWNMSAELQDAKTEINSYLQKVQAFQTLLSSDTVNSTLYINTQSLDALVNLSLIMSSLGTVIDGYGVAIDASKNFTSETTLLDAMGSMLALSADIGKTSNSILEMADQILLMADNIGMEADQILLTQQLQSANILAVQTSILAAQQLAVGIIAASN